ncbi:hypothetical protein ACH4VR_25420 [Streptomyces sp. NPDC020883]|uniref:hypothetical protein n=1 Tax=Streptomyces sp. NPDC020883 TaxID=3365099 RepID=UPI0037A981BB
MVHSQSTLLGEGFNEVIFAESLYRLDPFLQTLSEAHEAGLGHNEGEGLGDLLLVRRIFGPGILPLRRWKPGSHLVTGRDRVAEIRLGQQHLTLAYRDNIDGMGDFGFEAMVPCPFDPECDGYTRAPAYSITRLHRALLGELDNHQDIVCAVHGGFDDVDQEADDHAWEQLCETVGGMP